MDNSEIVAKLLDDYINNVIIITITKYADGNFNPHDYDQDEINQEPYIYRLSQKKSHFSSFKKKEQKNELYKHIISLCSHFKNKIVFLIIISILKSNYCRIIIWEYLIVYIHLKL